MSPKLLAFAVAWLVVGLAPARAAEGPATGRSPDIEHVRILWMHDPAETAMVSWTTPAAGTAHTVYYDTEPREGRIGAYRFKQPALPPRKYLMFPGDAGTPEGWAQNALLEHLTPATTYYLVVVSDGTLSREYHFVTAPVDDRPVKLLYGADARPARADPTKPHLIRRQINRRIAALVAEHPEILALAHGGDYDSHAEWRFLRQWLADEELTTTADGRLLPIIPTRGNHEGRQGHSTFEDMVYWPGMTTPYYYSTAVSGSVTVITLNTNAPIAGAQRDWLEAELRRERAKPGRWIIVQYHVPAYPSVKPLANGAQQRQHWVPLFEEFGVDLVCEADDHLMKRTAPIYRDHVDLERGITYIGDGGLGAPVRQPDLTRWYLQPPGVAKPEYHVHLIELGGDEMQVTAIGLDGGVLDHFVVKSKSAALAATP